MLRPTCSLLKPHPARHQLASLLQTSARRWIKTDVSDLRKGDYIDYNGRVMVVQLLTSIHTGRGARAFNLLLKEPASDALISVRPTAKDSFDKPELVDKACQLAYSTDQAHFFVDPATLEEFAVPRALVRDKLGTLFEPGTQVKLRLHGDSGRVVELISPRALRCTVSEILEVKESSDKRTCVVRVQGGARIPSNLLLTVGEQISVDTTDLSSMGRAKAQ